MYSIDERLKGLPAVRDQVVQLYQSLNAPHLAIPGRKAGPAMAFVLGLRGPSGFAVFVYLYMQQSGEAAVYVPSSGTVPAERYESEEAEALGFVESMGFIMDNLNFRGRPADEQETIIRTMPVFMREPPPPAPIGGHPASQPAARPGTGPRPAASPVANVVQLGKLFSAFCLALLVQGCATVGEREKEQSMLRYEIAVQNLVKSPQLALREVEESLKFDPGNADAWHVKGILLHKSYGRLEEAQVAFAKALELKKPFSHANVNLGNLYMDQKRYDDAIEQFQRALDDVMYPDPYIPQGNMGWAYFRKGDSQRAIELIKGALSVNQKYCLGELWLGQIYEAAQNTGDSCKYFGRFREHCPDRSDAWQRDGLCLLNAGDRAGAKKAFETCIEKAPNDDQKDVCKQLKEQAGS
ncbi:MAG TPA: social motility TPR repeat lipoprotein Tgl [Archangium sp.]